MRETPTAYEDFYYVNDNQYAKIDYNSHNVPHMSMFNGQNMAVSDLIKTFTYYLTNELMWTLCSIDIKVQEV